MNAVNKLTRMCQQFYSQAEPCLEWWSFIRQNKIDLKAVLPVCGTLAVALCRAVETADGQFIFDFDPNGVPCVVIEGQLIGKVDGVRDYVTKDLIAWPIGAPDHFATAMGPGAGVALLGPVAAFRLPSDKTPLKLFRNPESWLVNGCEGSVVLKPEAAKWLNASSVPMVCEDVDHAKTIRDLLGPRGRHKKILIPNRVRQAA